MTQTTYRHPVYRGLAMAMAALLSFPANMAAQAPPAAPPAARNLRILPLAGNNGMNDLERQVMTPLAVQILDANDLPVEGATVIFRFPINGPSATFADQQTAQTIRTNAGGQARATGWTANNQVGAFIVQVTATRGTDQGLGTISMTNVSRITQEAQKSKKHWWSSKWAKIAYIAAAGAITTGIVLKNSGSTTISGTPGVPTIGGPQ